MSNSNKKRCCNATPFQTVDKLSGTCKILFLYFKTKFIAITNNRQAYLRYTACLCTFCEIPTYADEFIFTKSELSSQPLSACRQLLFLFFYTKNSDFADMTVILVRVCCTVTVVADITCFYRFREHILFKFA